jgi:hypothetical protein
MVKSLASRRLLTVTGVKYRLSRALAVSVMMLMAPALCWAGAKTCLTGTDPEVASDPAQIRTVRQLVHDGCVCSSYDGSTGKKHADYLKCALQIIKAQATALNLRTPCKASVLLSFARSTCGKNPALHSVACIKTSSKTGAVTCAIASTTKKDGSTPSGGCTDGKSSTKDACFGFTNCLDAADTNNNLIVAAPGDTGSCQATSCVRGRALVSGVPLGGGEPVYIYSTQPAPVCPGTPDSWGTLSSQGTAADDGSGNFCVDFPLAPLNTPGDPIRADRWVLPADCTERETVNPTSGVVFISRGLTDTNNATCETNPNDCTDVGDINLCGAYGC